MYKPKTSSRSNSTMAGLSRQKRMSIFGTSVTGDRDEIRQVMEQGNDRELKVKLSRTKDRIRIFQRITQEMG